MASGKTENYGLNQWEATDKVERLDFNADNAKIDAALHNMEQTYAADMEELRGAQWWGKILDKTLTSDTNSVTLTIPSPGSWQMLSLQFSASGPRYVYLSLNNGAGFYYNGSDGKVTEYTMMDCTSAITASGGKLEFYRGLGNSLYGFYQTAYIGSDIYSGNSTRSRTFLMDDLPLSGLTQIKLTANGNFKTGSQFVIYGLKK